MEELRLACGDVADDDVKTSQQSPSRHVSSLTRVNQSLGEIDNVAQQDAGKSDEEVMSDDELEELHEFMLTQRQHKLSARVPQIENSTGNEEDRDLNESGSSSDKEEVIDLSQALLRKLDETFAADHMEDEDQVLSSSSTEELEICDVSNNSVDTCDSDQLLVAALDSNVDVNSSSHTQLPAAANYQQDNLESSSKLEENVVASDDEDEETVNQHTSHCVQLDSGICDTLKDSQIDCSSLASAAEKDTMVSDIDGLVANVPRSADECEDKTSSNDMANNNPPEQQQLATPVPLTAVQTSHYAAASPPSLFEESSLEQWDMEDVNTSKDTPAPADDSRHILDADFIDDNGLINICESPNDMFESSSSHRSVSSPAASLQYESEVTCQQDNQTPQFSSVVAGSQVHFDVPTPAVLHECMTSVRENVQMQLQGSTEQGDKSSTEAEEVVLLDVIEANPPPGDCSVNSVISKRCNLRKVRAVTRNSLSPPDLAGVSRYSSTCALDISGTSFRHCRNPRSCPIYSDVEPDTDDDDVDKRQSPRTSPRKLSQLSGQASLRSSSTTTTQSATKQCCVKLKRIDSLPQVKLIIVFFQFVLILLLVTKLELNDI